MKLKEEPWTSCQEVRSQIPAAWRGPPGSPPTCCAVQALPGDREFQTRLRTRGKAVLQGSHHLLGDGVAQTEVPCLERRGLALPGSSHLMRRVTRSNNEFVRGCCSILSCHRVVVSPGQQVPVRSPPWEQLHHYRHYDCRSDIIGSRLLDQIPHQFSSGGVSGNSCIEKFKSVREATVKYGLFIYRFINVEVSRTMLPGAVRITQGKPGFQLGGRITGLQGLTYVTPILDKIKRSL